MRRSSEIPTKVLRLWDGRRCSLCAWLPHHRPPHLLGPWQVGNGIIVVTGAHCPYGFPRVVRVSATLKTLTSTTDNIGGIR